MLTESIHTLSTIKRLKLPKSRFPIISVDMYGQQAWTNRYICALLPIPEEYTWISMAPSRDFAEIIPDTTPIDVTPHHCAQYDKITVVVLSDYTVIDARYLALFLNRYGNVSLRVHTGDQPVVTVYAAGEIVGAIAPIDIHGSL